MKSSIFSYYQKMEHHQSNSRSVTDAASSLVTTVSTSTPDVQSSASIQAHLQPGMSS